MSPASATSTTTSSSSTSSTSTPCSYMSFFSEKSSREHHAYASLPSNSIVMPSDEDEQCSVPWPTTGSISISPSSSPNISCIVSSDQVEESPSVSETRTVTPDQELARPELSQPAVQVVSRLNSTGSFTCLFQPPQRRPLSEDRSQEQSVRRPVSPCNIMHALDAPLSWRMDPSHSFADWRLEIFNRSTKQFETYHVHRVVLCVGPRACAYFAHALQRDTHRIPLIAKACELVPQFLDYVYQLPTFDLDTQKAIGLAFIANTLQQPKLLQETMEFVYQNLDASNMHHYLEEATYYDQHELVDWILHMASEEVPTMEEHHLSAFLKELSLPQFIKLLERMVASQWEASLSTLLVDFCIYHPHELSTEFLENCCPHILVLKPEAAVALLELTLTLGDGKRTTLQEKCLQCICQHWHELDDVSIFEQLAENQPDLALEWLPQILGDASCHFQSVQDDLRDAWAHQASTQDQLSSTLSQLEMAQGEIIQLTRTLESTKMELRSQLHGLMKKRSSDRMEQQASLAHWNQERRLWKQERQRWLEERRVLEQELYRLKATAGTRRNRDAKKSKENVCPQVETQSILSYFSSVGMGDVDDSWDTSFEFSTK